MKKNFVSFLIPCLLLYFTGCYSMQSISKDKLSSKKSPELCLWTRDKEFKFDEYSYSITNDTLHGKGKYTCTHMDTGWIPFNGKVSLKDAKEIEISKLNIPVFILSAGVIVMLCIIGMKVAGDLSGPIVSL